MEQAGADHEKSVGSTVRNLFFCDPHPGGIWVDLIYKNTKTYPIPPPHPRLDSGAGSRVGSPVGSRGSRPPTPGGVPRGIPRKVPPGGTPWSTFVGTQGVPGGPLEDTPGGLGTCLLVSTG